jgi:hypothetical protein
LGVLVLGTDGPGAVLEVDGRQVLNNEELIREISARLPGSLARL